MFRYGISRGWPCEIIHRRLTILHHPVRLHSGAAAGPF
jgi:hypothetical protein